MSTLSLSPHSVPIQSAPPRDGIGTVENVRAGANPRPSFFSDREDGNPFLKAARAHRSTAWIELEDSIYEQCLAQEFAALAQKDFDRAQERVNELERELGLPESEGV